MKSLFVQMQNLYSDRSGITGLETAIILIAFIVVAAVFAFTVMTTGLFSTEKAKTTAQAGITEASSTFAPKGAIVAQATGLGTDNARVQTLFVQLQPATGSAGASCNPVSRRASIWFSMIFTMASSSSDPSASSSKGSPVGSHVHQHFRHVTSSACFLARLSPRHILHSAYSLLGTKYLPHI